MVAAPTPNGLTSAPVRQSVTRAWSQLIRRLAEPEIVWVLGLSVFTLLVGAALLAITGFPVTAYVLPIVVASLVLGPRRLPWFVLFVVGILMVTVAATAETQLDPRRIAGIVVSFLVGLIVLVASFRRSALGVSGGLGESMLVDLRDRITSQGRLPVLPRQWYAESVTRSAGGSAFAGDFMVAAISPDQRLLQVAVVDVSGKGERAGTRALLLSGSFGGLLAALPSAGFLPAANDYLIRQDWAEGFATAVHLSLDLTTGEFELRSAGHPPAVQLRAGSAGWVVHEAEGPVLGLIGNADFPSLKGSLQAGDTLLLYTDGLVETPQRDISLGIDMLLGEGERMLAAGYERGAQRLIDKMESVTDDRALLMVHRR